MFSRFDEQAHKGLPIPQEWKENVLELLEENFHEYLVREGKYFDLFGEIYPNEMSVALSCIDKRELQLAPVTCHLSVDVKNQDLENAPKILDSMIDVIGLMFDEISNDEEWSDYTTEWAETEHKGKKYFYKITRENIALTIEANKLLEKDNESN